MSMTPKAPAQALPEALTAVRVAAAPVDEAMGWLDSSGQGLSSAQVSARRARHGPNAVRTHHVNALAVHGRQLRSAVLILLAGTAVVSYFLGDSLQSIIIGVILAASIGLGFVNEYRAERAAAALHSGVRHTAVARRDGAFIALDVTQLVPGDVIRLSLGEAVPADLRLSHWSGMQREHPDRGIDGLAEVAPTGACRGRVGRIHRSGVHGHDRQRRGGHRGGVRHRPEGRVRAHRGRPR
jgi:Mg2+-importing ATPase